jgi:hypothetical protein
MSYYWKRVAGNFFAIWAAIATCVGLVLILAKLGTRFGPMAFGVVFALLLTFIVAIILES